MIGPCSRILSPRSATATVAAAPRVRAIPPAMIHLFFICALSVLEWWGLSTLAP